MNMFKTAAIAASLALATAAVHPAAAQDSGPEIYAKAMAGKRVLLVPMAMGFDLAQGWSAILKPGGRRLWRNVRDPRPELERRGRRPGDHRSDIL